ncbi:MAG: cation diffusion facilitator family transporter [Lachnospiraceae bacterium]|jgi:cation diffusion facilitator family transporter|nr:cation diffusion facilitator family transporter [Lachnospiraceae bacterium]
MPDKTKYIHRAALIAIFGNAILALAKIIVGYVAGSNALVGDGIDSSADVLIGILTLAVVRVIALPADAEHPWGHRRAEAVATAGIAFVLFFAGAQLAITSIGHLFSEEARAVPSAIALVATLISIVGKILLAWSQYILGKRADSAMVTANAKNMASDVLISAGVLVGLTISLLTGNAHADTILAILIGLWIIRVAVGIFLEANLELMDGNHDVEPYRVIIEAVNSVEGAFSPHRARMRQIGGFWEINFDIDVDPDCTIKEAHDIASQIEQEIKKRLENIFDIMIHIEPRGSDDSGETYGLSENEMKGSY